MPWDVRREDAMGDTDATQCSRVVVLADGANSHQSLGILVGTVGVDVVQGGGLTRVTIAAGEVYTYSKVDLAATHNILQEGVEMGDLCVCVCVCVLAHESYLILFTSMTWSVS